MSSARRHPLAIELAAARTISLSPQQIASYLDQRLRILTVGDRTALPHHQTLRATIDWSYQLLNPSERTLFHRLSIFGSSFSLEAAQEICTDTRLAPIDVIDLLPALVEESLVTVDHAPTATRYRLLETISEYASEQLANAEETAPLQRSHGSYYLHLAEEAEPNLRTAKQHETAEMFEIEHDNFRQALRWAVDRRQTETAYRLTGALCRFWSDKFHTVEGLQWLAAVLDLDGPVDDSIRAKVLQGAGALASDQADQTKAISYMEEAVEIYRRFASDGGSQLELGAVLHNLARVFHYQQGDLNRAEPLYQEALGIFRHYNQWGVALALGNLSFLAVHKGDMKMAQDFNSEHLRIANELGPLQLGMAYDASAAFHMASGDIERAIEDLNLAAQHYEGVGHHAGGCLMRVQLAAAHLESGNLEAACDLFIPNARDVLTDPEYEARLGHIAELAVLRMGLDLAVHKPERAAILLGAIDSLLGEGASVLSRIKILDHYREKIDRLLDREILENGLARGATMTREEVRSFITEPISPKAGVSN